MKEELEAFRKRMEAELQAVQQRLKESVRAVAEKEIASMGASTEERIEKARRLYDESMARLGEEEARGMPDILLRPSRELTRSMLEQSISFHQRNLEMFIASMQQYLA